MIAEAFSEVVEKEEPSPLTLPVHESTEDEVDLTGIVPDESVMSGELDGWIRNRTLHL